MQEDGSESLGSKSARIGELFLGSTPGYPSYRDGMELPEGLSPPIPGLGHADLVGAAVDEALASLARSGVPDSDAILLAQAFGSALASDFEQQLAEYKIASYALDPSVSPEQRRRDSAALAELYAEMAALVAHEAFEELAGVDLERSVRACAAGAARDRIFRLISLLAGSAP